MINKKIVALAASAAMVASLSVGFMTTTSAYDPSARGELLGMEYDAASSTDTQKVVKIYYAGDSVVSAFIGLELSTDKVTNAEFTSAITEMNDITDNLDDINNAEAPFVGFLVLSMADAAYGNEDHYLGSVTFTVPADIEDFTVSFSDDASCQAYKEDECYCSDYADVSITVPGAAADPTEPPTQAPTATPTAAPTATPTAAPTATPTAAPTATPTAAPTATPTAAPTAEPTDAPTLAPVEDHDDGFAFAAKIDEIKNAAQLMLTVKATKGGVTKEGSKNIKGDIATISGAGDLKLGVIIANIPGDVTIDSVSIKPIY